MVLVSPPSRVVNGCDKFKLVIVHAHAPDIIILFSAWVLPTFRLSNFVHSTLKFFFFVWMFWLFPNLAVSHFSRSLAFSQKNKNFPILPLLQSQNYISTIQFPSNNSYQLYFHFSLFLFFSFSYSISLILFF